MDKGMTCVNWTGGSPGSARIQAKKEWATMVIVHYPAANTSSTKNMLTCYLPRLKVHSR